MFLGVYVCVPVACEGQQQNGRACCAGIVQVVEDWHTKIVTRSHTCLVTVDDIVFTCLTAALCECVCV